MKEFSLGTKFKRARRKFFSFVGQYPGLALPLIRLYPKWYQSVIKKDTELVIEGFPRSANTFSVLAFKQAQKNPVNLAHHLHMPFQIKTAVKRNVPTLVLIRKPQDAIASWRVMAPHLTFKQLLKDYIRFYKNIEPLAAKFVIASFDEITTDFGNVIKRVNDFYGTSFDVFIHNQDIIWTKTKEAGGVDKWANASKAVKETTVARPSKLREEKYRQIDELFSLHSELLAQANDLYKRFIKRQID